MSEREKNNLFLFWGGEEYTLIKLLRRYIYLHSESGSGYNVHFLTPSNLRDYIDEVELPQKFDEMKYAHKADIIRVLVIYKYGGIWVDSDTLIMKSLDDLFAHVHNDEESGFFILENNEILWNGVFGSKAQTDLMKHWKEGIMEIVNTKGNAISWTEIGNAFLMKLFRSKKHLFSGYKVYRGLDTMYPSNWCHCVRDYVKRPYEHSQTLIRPFQPIIVLVNSVYKELASTSEVEILTGRLPLNYFLALSLTNSGNNMSNNNKNFNI